MQSNYYVSDNDRFTWAESWHIDGSVIQLTRTLVYIDDKVDEICVVNQA